MGTRLHLILVVALLTAGGALAAPATAVRRETPVMPPAVAKTLDDAGVARALSPLRFEANDGQTDGRARVVARGLGLSALLARDQIVASAPDAAPLTVRFSGASPSARVAPERALSGQSNSLIGDDPARYRRGLATYETTRYTGLYDGVDAVVRGDGSELSCAFEIRPGSDPSAIRLDLGSPLRVDATGELVVERPGGPCRVRLTASQDVDGQSRGVPVRYSVERGGRQVGFVIGDYDTTRTVLVTPTITFSTFLGGTMPAEGESDVGGVAIGPDGSIFVAGETSEVDFPTTVTTPFPTIRGDKDIFVTKIDPSTGALVYSTYFGGGGDAEELLDLAVDSAGNACVCGYTTALNFPTTPGSFQPHAANADDAFVCKLNAQGSAFVFSTYFGGDGGTFGAEDIAHGIAVDKAGAVYITGATTSDDLPTMNPVRPTRAGPRDAFVAKFTPDGSALVYSTYLGGSVEDFGTGIAVDTFGRAVAVGFTFSGNFPRRSAIQDMNSGSSDLYITRYNADGTDYEFSTYFGGGGTDQSKGVKIDADGNIYVLGEGLSVNFPTTAPTQPLIGGDWDVFVIKLAPTGTSVLFSTFLGGSGYERAGGIAVDDSGHVYVSGYVFSSTAFPVTQAVQPTYGGGDFDAFVTRIDLLPSPSIGYSTYLGGSNTDYALAIAADAQGCVVGGGTSSLNFPTVAPGDTTINGGADSFVTRLRAPVPGADTPSVYVADSGGFFLKNSNSAGAADLLFTYGPTGGFVPIRGDWNGDGIDTPGVYDPSNGAFYLRNSNSPGPADLVFSFGAGSHVPITGDWDGDGVDTVGLYVPGNGGFFLKNSNSGGPADATFGFGAPGDSIVPLAGDWDGNGTDTIGIYTPTTGAFFLRNANSAGPADLTFFFGPPGGRAIGGDWNGDGADTIGLYVPATGVWFLRNTNTPGAADLTFSFGPPNATPLTGDWNGL